MAERLAGPMVAAEDVLPARLLLDHGEAPRVGDAVAPALPQGPQCALGAVLLRHAGELQVADDAHRRRILSRRVHVVAAGFSYTSPSVRSMSQSPTAPRAPAGFPTPERILEPGVPAGPAGPVAPAG